MPPMCPICMGVYTAVERSLDVCEGHQNWFVITCSICGRSHFSESVGVCNACAPVSIPQPAHGSPLDRHAYLRWIGQEGYE